MRAVSDAPAGGAGSGLVVTLGRFSMARFSPGARIGRFTEPSAPPTPVGRAEGDDVRDVPSGCRSASGILKQTLFTDMQGVPAALTEARAFGPPTRPRVKHPPRLPRSVTGGPELLAVTPDPEAAPRPSGKPSRTRRRAGVEFDPTAQLGLF